MAEAAQTEWPKVILGRALLGYLVDAGVVGQYVTRVVIEADVDNVLLLYTSSIGDDRIIGVDFTGLKPEIVETPTTVHACPPEGGGLTPCCGRTPFELPSNERLTAHGELVTCTGKDA